MPYIPNCATPLVFENDFEEAPYGMAGTGFLLRSNTSFYFLTAKHALTLGDHEQATGHSHRNRSSTPANRSRYFLPRAAHQSIAGRAEWRGLQHSP